MLTEKVRIERNDNKAEPEDFFAESLATIFVNDSQNSHGDPSATVIYRSSKFDRDIRLQVADPTTEDERRLFAHYLWNAAVQLAELISNDPDFEVKNERVLELGAGLGLAGIVAALNGADVVLSDYPSKPILETLEMNLNTNLPGDIRNRVEVRSHIWGNFDDGLSKTKQHSFSKILAADCFWMPWEHANLVDSMLHFLSNDTNARVWAIAGFHTGRSKLAPFFDVVEEKGLQILRIYEIDVDGNIRSWQKVRDGGLEDVTERKRWLVVAEIKRFDQGAARDANNA